MRARVRRLLLTVLTAAVGVAVITGTLVFADTIDGAVSRVFAGTSRGADVVVAPRQTIASDQSLGTPVSAGLLRRIRRLSEVRAAAGQISDIATVVGRDGRPIGNGRIPTLALSALPRPFQGIRLVAGSPPRGADEIVVDRGTASQDALEPGSLVPVVTSQPERSFRVSGIAVLDGGQVSGQPFVVFSLREAQSLYDRRGTYDRVLVAGVTGASATRLAGEIQPLLPAGLVARPRASAVDAQSRRVEDRLRSLTAALEAFALIAVLVGGLLVFNSFAATGPRRQGELALLRTLGATRAQTMRAVLLEAGIVGTTGAALGIGIGILAALLVRAVFEGQGSGLPAAGLVVHWRTVLVAVAVGLGVTMAAGLWPAIHAARAAPLEALRSAAAPSRPRVRALQAGLAGVLAAAGLALILTAGGAAGSRLRTSAIGGGLVVVATLVAAPSVVAVMAGPVSWILARRNPVVAGLAREQALQNPVRTAISASSLTIGLALVLLVTVYAGGLRAAGRDAVRSTFLGDAAIESQDGTSAMPASVVQAAAVAPGVLALSALRTVRANLGAAGAITVSGIDPASWPLVYRFRWVRGTARTLSRLSVGHLLVEADTARADGLAVGRRAILRTSSGRSVSVQVDGIYQDAGLLPGVVISAPWFSELFEQPRLEAVFAKLASGPGRKLAFASLRAAVRRFPGIVVRSESAVADRLQNGVSAVVGLFYGLLVLSLFMSLIGIMGTLNLSIHERTRELGLLRAVGMTVAQARALVRNESLIAAAVGASTGVLLGLLLGWAVTSALAPQGLVFVMPWLGLVLAVLVGITAGVAAAIPPGRRATRLDVLAAIAHE